MKMRVEGPLDFMPWERAYGLLAKVQTTPISDISLGQTRSTSYNDHEPRQHLS